MEISQPPASVAPSSPGTFDVPGHLGLELRSNNTKGRHLVTTRHFKAGELVLAQRPYAAVLQEAEVSERCDWCLQAKPDLLRCSRSHYARYCSRAHQKAAWEAGYKKECAALVACTHAAHGRTPTPTMRLAARIVWKAARQRQKPQELPGSTGSWPAWPAPGGSWAHVLGLQDHWQSISDANKLTFAQVAAAARQYAASADTTPITSATADNVTTATSSISAAALQLPVANGAANEQQNGTHINNSAGSVAAAGHTPDEWEADGLPSVRTMSHLIARIACNSHTICDEELRAVGLGLYPLACMANHACNPSCMQSFDLEGIICFRALRDLAPGDEITISYVEIAATQQQRREALWEQYHFDSVSSNGTSSAQEHTQQVQHGLEGDALPQFLRPAPSACLFQSRDGSWVVEDRQTSTPTGTSPAQPQDLHHQQKSQQDSKVVLHIYGQGPDPPWPCTTADAQLTQIEVATGGSPRTAFVPVPGGLQVRICQHPAPLDLSWLCGDEIAGAGQHVQAVSHPSSAQGPQTLANLYSQVDCWGEWACAPHLIMVPVGLQSEAIPPIQPVGLQTEAIPPIQPVGLQGEAIPPTQPVGLQGEAIPPTQHQPDSGGPSDTATVAPVASVAAGTTGRQGNSVWLDVEELATKVTAMADMLTKSDQLQQANQHSAAVKLLQQALATADNMSVRMWQTNPITSGAGGPAGQQSSARVRVGDHHGLRMQLLQKLLHAAISTGKAWQEALCAAEALTPTYELVYPRVWPALGLHYATIAKLAAHLDKLQLAVVNAEKALSCLRITHAGAWADAGTALCGAMARLRWEAHQELGLSRQAG